MGWASGVKGQAMATATRPAGPPPPKAPSASAVRQAYLRGETTLDDCKAAEAAEGPRPGALRLSTIDRALAWYERGRQEGVAQAAAYLRQCGRDEWADGLEAALGAKEGD